MNDDERGTVRLIALFPHEDAARRLRCVKADLFRLGLAGARSLPLFAILESPFLASCGLDGSRPATRVELARLAASVAAVAAASVAASAGTGADSREKPFRFSTGAPKIARPYAGSPRVESPFAGLPLLVLPLDPQATSLVLAVLRSDEALPAGFSAPPSVRFNAAFVANLAIRALDGGAPGLSYGWARGAPVWLPSAARQQR